MRRFKIWDFPRTISADSDKAAAEQLRELVFPSAVPSEYLPHWANWERKSSEKKTRDQVDKISLKVQRNKVVIGWDRGMNRFDGLS